MMIQEKKEIKSICEIVEELLLKENVEDLNEDEIQLISEHLKECGRCNHIAETLENIQHSMSASPDNFPEPLPEIRRELLKRMEFLYTDSKNGFRNSLKWLKAVLEYRIPVYQVVSVAFLGIIILLGVNRISEQKSIEPQIPMATIQNVNLINTQLNILDNFQIISEQRIGQNVSEDSMLTRFIVSSM